MSRQLRKRQETRGCRAAAERVGYTTPELRDSYLGRLAAGDQVVPLLDGAGRVMGYRAFEFSGEPSAWPSAEDYIV